MSVPFASVVVPTCDRSELLAGCVQSLLAQGYPADRFEIVIVDNGSVDATPRLLAAWEQRTVPPAFRCLTLPERDANTARNAGAAAARGDPICFVDDDVVAPPGWLGALVAGAGRDPAAGCVGGPIRPRFAYPPPRTCDRHVLPGSILDEGPEERTVNEVWGGNMALRRFALDATGGFREGLRFHQEWEWQQRLLAGGGHIRYVPDAWLWHCHARPQRIPSLLYEYFRRGYIKAALGYSVPPRQAARNAGAHLRHALRARCARGLMEAARSCGLLCHALLRRGPG